MATKAEDIPRPLSNADAHLHYDTPAAVPEAVPPTLTRIQEMRAALARGEDPLAAGAAAQAAATAHDAGMAAPPEPDAVTEPPATEPPLPTETPTETPPAVEPVTEPVVEPAAEPITVSLPGREGQEPLELALPDEDAAERIRALINNGMRRREHAEQMAVVKEHQAELTYIYQSMEADPAGFLAENIPAATRADVAKYLLATMPEEQFTALVDALAGWQDDPRDREINALKLDHARIERSREAKEKRDAEAVRQRKSQNVSDAIEALIPDSMSKEQGDSFYGYARFQIQQYINQHQLPEFDPAQVPAFLDKVGLLKMAGIALPLTPRTSATPPTAGAPAPAAAPLDDVARAQAGAAAITARLATKQASSAVTPHGVGAAPTSSRPYVPGEGGLDRIAKARQRLAQTGRI